jgi:hypothetical protein
MEHPPEPTKATHLGTWHNRVSVSRTECPTVTVNVRLVSKCTQWVTKTRSYPIAIVRQ